jgi:hypothetical protein
MDCMDCHNRPSHNYQTPIRAINDAMTAGSIPTELPEVKFMAMSVMNMPFSTEDSAMMGIDSAMREYYSQAYEEIYSSKPELVDQAIAGIQEAYKQNIFPEMKVNWDVYPNHIGHLEFNGCFRCHNDRHTTADGSRKISMDCNLCHEIIAQGTPDSMQVMSGIGEPLEFYHQDDQDWQGNFCSECHRDLYK